MFESFAYLPNLDIALNIAIIVFLISFFTGGVYFWKKKHIKTSIVFFLGFLCIVWGTFFETKMLVVREISLEIQSLPSVRIGVVADFHLRPSKKEAWVQKVVDTLNKQDIDFIVIPGDFLTSTSQEFSGYFSPLKDLTVPTYHVLGNHDYSFNYEWRSNEDLEFLRNNLRKVESIELQNESVFLEKHGINLVGIEDNYYGFHDLEKAYANISEKFPVILLAHSPDIVDEVSQDKADLIISGHTHCGQIRLPFLGAIPYTVPTSNGKKLERHWYEDEKIFITCGVGESGAPSRFLNPPEVVVLDIN